MGKHKKPRAVVPEVVRFWPKVEKGDGCWEWMGIRNQRGYGLFSRSRPRRCIGAHRMSWLLVNGEIPDGLIVCHRCDNPACVRPDHLFLGSYKDNAQDCIAKMRRAKHYRFGPRHNRLTDDQVREIRKMWDDGAHYTAIALKFGIQNSTVYGIGQRKRKAHVV